MLGRTKKGPGAVGAAAEPEFQNTNNHEGEPNMSMVTHAPEIQTGDTPEWREDHRLDSLTYGEIHRAAAESDQDTRTLMHGAIMNDLASVDEIIRVIQARPAREYASPIPMQSCPTYTWCSGHHGTVEDDPCHSGAVATARSGESEITMTADLPSDGELTFDLEIDYWTIDVDNIATEFQDIRSIADQLEAAAVKFVREIGFAEDPE